MPLFETNTNRFCTRSPSTSDRQEDTPHLPVDLPYPVPRSLTAEYVAKQYGPLACADTAQEVPWRGGRAEAGDVPTSDHDFEMDAFGTVSYKHPTYPVFTTPMFELNGLYTEWGEACSGTVRWGSSPPCSPPSSSSSSSAAPGEVLEEACPKNTACLRLQSRPNNATSLLAAADGMCFSIEAFRKDSTRMPCFTTEHCPDGLVCLADGGCAPLYVHVWNAEETGIRTLEFGVLADDCGFSNSEHPYTQSLRGASAWEQVPDLLHAHGMCSHRSWFAYRNAIQDQVPPCHIDYLPSLRGFGLLVVRHMMV
jgi:hypothetical protein